jgi:hypothetical protein
VTAIGTTAIGATAIGATAIGATAIGATAIGATAIGATATGVTAIGSAATGVTAIGSAAIGATGAESAASTTGVAMAGLACGNRVTEDGRYTAALGSPRCNTAPRGSSFAVGSMAWTPPGAASSPGAAAREMDLARAAGSAALRGSFALAPDRLAPAVGRGELWLASGVGSGATEPRDPDLPALAVPVRPRARSARDDATGLAGDSPGSTDARGGSTVSGARPADKSSRW